MNLPTLLPSVILLLLAAALHALALSRRTRPWVAALHLVSAAAAGAAFYLLVR